MIRLLNERNFARIQAGMEGGEVCSPPSNIGETEVKPWRRIASAVFVLSLLAGCATVAPMRPLASEAEARAVHGEPAARWQNDDGTSTLEYSTQPNGDIALMITVDASGAVVRQENALSLENLARVERGMTREQVARLLGAHRSVQTFALSGEEVWDWNIRNDGPGIATLFNVHFIDGKVVRTSRTYVFPHDSGFGGFLGYASPSHPHYAYPFPYRSRFPYRRPYRGWPSPWHYW